MDIQITPITTQDEKLYQFYTDVLTDSFPKEEYRNLDKIAYNTDNEEKFTSCVLTYGGNPVGIISYWDIDDYCYVEHFAIKKELRGSNYGGNSIRKFINHISKNIILEVELPVGVVEQKRIEFYKKIGFSLWSKDYKQPPYRNTDGYIDMLIMCHGTLDEEKAFDIVKKGIYSVVYGIR